MSNVRIIKLLESAPSFKYAKHMLETGSAPITVARYMQSHGDFDSLQLGSLTHYLRFYLAEKKDTFKIAQAPQAVHLLTASIDNEDHLDPLQVYQLVIAVQVERVMCEFNAEMKAGKITDLNTRAIETLNKVLMSAAQIDLDKQKLDLQKRLSKKFGAHIPRGVSEEVQKIKEEYASKWGAQTAQVMLNPDSRRRVLNAIEHVRSAAAGPVAEVLRIQAQKIVAMGGEVDEKMKLAKEIQKPEEKK